MKVKKKHRYNTIYENGIAIAKFSSYHSIHMWLKNHLGKADHCEYDNSHVNRKYSWCCLFGNSKDVNYGNMTFSSNIDNYVQLCQSCHRLYDYGKIKIRGKTLMDRGGEPRITGFGHTHSPYVKLSKKQELKRIESIREANKSLDLRKKRSEFMIKIWKERKRGENS